MRNKNLAFDDLERADKRLPDKKLDADQVREWAEWVVKNLLPVIV